jgi:hypothetical protein
MQRRCDGLVVGMPGILHFADVLRNDCLRFAFREGHGLPLSSGGFHAMKRLLLIAGLALFLTHQPVQAADISVLAEATDAHPGVILLKGKIEGQDIDLFSMRALDQKRMPAIVFLDSPGGRTMTAVHVG